MIPYVSRRRALLIGVVLSTLAACSSSPAITPLPSGGEPPSDCARAQDGVINLSAKELKFSAPCLVAEAGEAFTIHFTNEDSQPHNVAVFTDSSKATKIMEGNIVATQGDSMDYQVAAQDEGQYYFDCQIHPEMNGALYVVSS